MLDNLLLSGVMTNVDKVGGERKKWKREWKRIKRSLMGKVWQFHGEIWILNVKKWDKSLQDCEIVQLAL